MPDVIILDMSMPVMHGLEAGPILKITLPATHLILFAISADLFTAEEVKRAGFSAAICKSSPDKLLSIAQELFARSA
jgi:DNA-binding NarL/FixJ family response regulator